MRKPKIVVVGSLNMDLVISMKRMPKIGETLLGKEIHYIPGGKGANQAVGSIRLGADVTMVGAVGGDAFGAQMVNNMYELGIHTAAVASIDGVPTGTAAILHTEEDNSIVVIQGANAHCSAESVHRHAEMIQQADILLVQLEIPMSAVTTALQIAKDAGVTTILNPAPALPLSDSLLDLVDVFTPNETEFEFYCGAACPTLAEMFIQMEHWHKRYGHTLVVTRGEAGVSCIHNGVAHTVPAVHVQPVDTTGAGDAFNAALAYSIASGWELNHCLAFAVKSASLSVLKFGAQDGMPTIDEVNSSELQQ